MKKFITFIVLPLCFVTSCEKFFIDENTIRTEDDLFGSYRLDKVVDTYVLNEENKTDVIFEYIDNGYSDIIDWNFRENNKLVITCRFFDHEWVVNNEYTAHVYRGDDFELNPFKMYYKVEDGELFIINGQQKLPDYYYFPEGEKLTIDNYTHYPGLLTLSYEYRRYDYPWPNNKKVITVKRTFQFKIESSVNYQFGY